MNSHEIKSLSLLPKILIDTMNIFMGEYVLKLLWRN